MQETMFGKGSGFRGNLLVVAVSVLLYSLLGLPWMCLAAVETSNHIDSLRFWKKYVSKELCCFVLDYVLVLFLLLPSAKFVL